MPCNIPVLHVEGRTLAEAYEKALIKLWHNGVRFSTQYDKPGDPQSIDATMNITVEAPMEDPMIHKAFPGGIEDLREYVMELEGYKDDWVKAINDPDDTRWEYTYSGRFRHWGRIKKKLVRDKFVEGCRDTYQHIRNTSLAITEMDGDSFCMWDCKEDVDQIEMVIDKLCEQPFTRQAQMITWDPRHDLGCYDPPCLRQIWLRIVENENGIWYLNYNVGIRSNDAFGAYFMNSFGITMMVYDLIAKEIMRRTGKDVKMGRMNWQADSWHIYGKDLKQAKERLFDRLDKTEFEDRVMRMDDSTISEIYAEAEELILEKIQKTRESF